MADPILIWGAGAIGGTIGAYWARAGENVLMVDIIADHAERCSTDGLAITGPVEEFRQVVKTVTPDALSGTFERIVLAVKAHHTEEAATNLRPHLADDGFVLSAQREQAPPGVTVRPLNQPFFQSYFLLRLAL